MPPYACHAAASPRPCVAHVIAGSPYNRTLDPSARPVTGRARQKARPAPVRSSGQRERYAY
jgi:hypothetical protein